LRLISVHHTSTRSARLLSYETLRYNRTQEM